MIVTVTPNPSLDLTLEVDHLRRGAVHRAVTARVEAGGKGVNVARALNANGYAVRAIVPSGGPDGDHLLALLAEAGLEIQTVVISQPIRTNVSLVEPNGEVTKVNASGPHLNEEEVEALLKSTATALEDATWLAASGSLPPGAPADLYARMIADGHDAGCRVAIDTSGDPLSIALAAGPDIIKPNETELAAAVERPLATLGDVVDAARELRSQGAGSVIVSLGAAGAILVDATSALHARPPTTVAKSNVGAGDAALAGFLAAGGSGANALRTAVAWGTAAAGLPGTTMPGPRAIDIDPVSIDEVDPDRPLEGAGGSL